MAASVARPPEDRPITELICAGNSASYFNYDIVPIRPANKPGFLRHVLDA
jgi:hypothetical protein